MKRDKKIFLGTDDDYGVMPSDEENIAYDVALLKQERMERIELVSDQLKQRYERHSDVQTFIEYICATDKVFARAESDKWSINKTEQAMIESEIYLMSLRTGIDEDIFQEVYEKFIQMNKDAQSVQIVAKKLYDKYGKKYGPCCTDFITYLRDYLLIFSRASKKKYSLSEAKGQLIRARMKVLALGSDASMYKLERIYDDFLELLKPIVHEKN